MKEKELQILNLALGGEKIHGLGEETQQTFSKPVVQMVKESLMKKGLLKNENEFTEQGIQLAIQLMQYQKAYKYIHVAHAIIGCYGKENAILFVKGGGAEYSLYRDKRSRIIETLLEQFLVNVSEERNAADKEYEEKIPFNVLLKKYELHRNNHLYLREVRADGTKSGYLFLKDEGRSYCYDIEKEILYSSGALKLQELFESGSEER